ncbi:unnamed protein product [Microthlaspi erraticum]|uniref:F-box domain-containing protein n=1 Tax=Microthlaspi erraticum TaxID=1685480 RepID=A0A6D2IHV1_9BRAS|nr:unnamed protein product [Microthlaspi erraticum]
MKLRWRNLSEDLVFEILTRLPAKSIATCPCVSKLWASIIRRPDFTELFFTRSYARPQLLFACKNDSDSELFFFTSPQLQNPDMNLSLIAAKYHMNLPLDGSFRTCFPVPHVHGLVCVTYKRIVKERKETVRVICNPSTGEY